MAGGLFALPKMYKITQNSLLKKHGIFCLTFSEKNRTEEGIDKLAFGRYNIFLGTTRRMKDMKEKILHEI